ncbi:hypothetical protein CPB86DRAFT_710725, partial [Serendipita vermifera]
IRLWDATTGQAINEPFRGHTERVFCVSFSPDGRQLVSGSKDRTIRLWHAETGQASKAKQVMLLIPLRYYCGVLNDSDAERCKCATMRKRQGGRGVLSFVRLLLALVHTRLTSHHVA